MNAVSKAQEKAEPIEIDEGQAGGATALQPVPARPKKKNRLRLVLMVVVPLGLAVAGGWWWITGGRYQETEDAYLQQPKVAIASEIAGRVVESDVADSMHVAAGDVLFRVDPEPYRIALAQAEASLEGARIQVEQLRAAYSQAEAQQRDAESEVAYLETQLQRQQDLSKKGVASQSALDEAERNLQKAKEALSADRQAVASALAALGGNPEIETDSHPTVLSALAARDRAAYELQQTTVKAPADGIVSQASDFKVGKFVSAGTALFTLVETQDSWVEANFKETQLTHIRPGQKAEVIFDTYPDRSVEATVEDISAGTGAEFSLLPAQNATGNWVKVTQRIPVRVKLDAADADLPLRTGMSATVTVDTEVARGFAGLFGGPANAAE
ncbi:HlyD family secretion protein [Chelativorans sp. AA-79]|uniref:HlyD family secretion protein n=1 Tax=Chelativorans sp. AA-79 TaxID=3028735 RepID=UPI0023F78FCF|nr:HlyD family secretion protein [Chelativorans sp. AA-79]WEX07584.1 HlyD family secretion protein [Chelativorans sp. AA-79]